MGQILVKESIPGAGAASSIVNKLKGLGIHDVQLFYDKGILPNGMWAVVQIVGQSHHSNLIMPESYNSTPLKPYLLWWCKDERAQFRVPNDQDLINILTVVKRAQGIWDKGEKRADDFDKKDADKDEKHKQKFKQKIHEIAPAMKKALKKGNL